MATVAPPSEPTSPDPTVDPGPAADGRSPLGGDRRSRWPWLLVAAPFVVLWLISLVSDILPDRLVTLTADQAAPFRDWANSAMNFLRNEEVLGLSFKEITRAISGTLGWPLSFSESLLTDSSFALPWVMIFALFTIVGHMLGGVRLALLGAGTMLYLSFFGMWDDAMITLSIVLVCAPLAALIGWALGLWATRSRRFEAFLIPVLNVMQSLPHFSYLVVIAVFVGIGDEAGAIATIMFAMPPMARLTILGLRGVPTEVVEAGTMSGCTTRQMLWKVELPAARPALMVGLNQVIMGCFGMAVLASFVGTRGLGLPLLNFLNAVRIGDALQYGVALVLMAIMLDRFTQAAGVRVPEHQPEGLSWIQRHPHLTAAMAVSAVAIALAPFIDAVRVLPDSWTVDTSDFWDAIVDWIKVELRGPLEGFREFMVVWVLVPLKNAFLSIPWIALVALAAGAGWKLGRLRLAAIAGGLVAFLALAGYWVESMETLYLVFAAVIISSLIGIPAGILAASSDNRTRVMQLVLDTFQVLPSFIYLIPVVMLWGVGPVAALIAILVYSTVPAVRYTMLGLRKVPADIIEAGKTSGCTGFQLLRKVRLPMAFPEIMLGINQTLMFGLLLGIIAAFIGGIDGLGDEILRARTEPNDVGEGLVAGFCVAAMGLAVDQLITSYARRRKAQLGLE